MASGKYSYRFAPRANGDLEETLKYIERELKNPKAAEDFSVKLFEKIDAVRNFPDLGKAVDNEYIIDQTLRRFMVDNYVVFYKPDENARVILIVRIVYGKRNMDEFIKNLFTR
jgi:plasmid stabilization system protein ParE